MFCCVGRLLAAAVSAAVVQSFLPGGPAIKTTDFSWDGGNVVGFLRLKYGVQRDVDDGDDRGELGEITHMKCFFFVWVEDLEDFIAKHLPSGKLTRQWKNGPVEDVFLIEHGDFPLPMLVCWRVIGSTTYYFVNGS